VKKITSIVLVFVLLIGFSITPIKAEEKIWKLGDRIVPGPLPPSIEAGKPEITRKEDIRYGDISHWQAFDFEKPVVCEDQIIPLVVFFHGDGFSPDITKDRGTRNPPSILFLQLGFAIASVDYRVVSEIPFPALVNDCKLAIRYFRKNANELGIDPDRIAVWGPSMGGYLSTFLGFVNDNDGFEGEGLENISSTVSAVVDYFGVKAVGRIDTKQAVRNRPIFIGEDGGTEEFQRKAYKASPYNYVDENDPPTLMIHGDKDTKVNYEQSVLFAKKGYETGNNIVLIKVDNAEHGFTPTPEGAEIFPGLETIHFATIAHIARYVEPEVLGDLNLDGKITIDDAINLAMLFGHQGTDAEGNPASDFWNPLADIEPDGKIDIKDWNAFWKLF